ncbi:hypothetical protein Dimus_033555 [Dionaea muscipula]
MKDSVEVIPPDLGFPSLSGDDLKQVDGDEFLPSTARQEGVDLIGCSDLVLGGDSMLLPSGLGSKAMVCPASVNAGNDAAVVDGEPQSTIPSLVSLPIPSQSQFSPALICTDEQRDGGVGGDGGELGVENGVGEAALVKPTELVCSSLSSVYVPAAELVLGDGGADGLQKVEGGIGGDALLLPTASICSILPCMPSEQVCSLLPAVDTTFDGGFVRGEVRVSSTARRALRTQPTDGLCQPPSSPVEPVSERVEKEKGILGGMAPRPAPPVQPLLTESAHVGLQTPILGNRTARAGRTVE